MTGLGHHDEFPIMSTLVCIVTYQIESIMSHNVKLSSSHDFTKMFHYIVPQS